MFGLFASARKKATQGAIDAMRPMIGCLQGLGGPGVPAGMWHDPYILGFTHRSIGAWAQFMTGFKTKPMDLGFALMATYTAISNMNGNELANAASELAVAKD